MSTSSSDSFRFTPNNSFSSSIKESLSRRETGPLKTPNKTHRHSKNLNFVLERTNLWLVSFRVHDNNLINNRVWSCEWWQHICYSRAMTTKNHQDLWPQLIGLQCSSYIIFTLFPSYRMMLGAVSPRPSFSYPLRVAMRTTRDAKAGPNSKSHSE